jgi:serine/threonine-protein kinase HipA
MRGEAFADLVGHHLNEILTAFGLPVPDQVRE